MRQRKLFEKSFLWTPSKTFTRLMPDFGRANPKQRKNRSALSGGRGSRGGAGGAGGASGEAAGGAGAWVVQVAQGRG